MIKLQCQKQKQLQKWLISHKKTSTRGKSLVTKAISSAKISDIQFSDEKIEINIKILTKNMN